MNYNNVRLFIFALICSLLLSVGNVHSDDSFVLELESMPFNLAQEEASAPKDLIEEFPFDDVQVVKQQDIVIPIEVTTDEEITTGEIIDLTTSIIELTSGLPISLTTSAPDVTTGEIIDITSGPVEITSSIVELTSSIIPQTSEVVTTGEETSDDVTTGEVVLTTNSITLNSITSDSITREISTTGDDVTTGDDITTGEEITTGEDITGEEITSGAILPITTGTTTGFVTSFQLPATTGVPKICIVSIRLDGDFFSVSDWDSWKAAFLRDLAAVLGVDTTRFMVLSVKSGSIIVETAFMAGEGSSPLELANLFVAKFNEGGIVLNGLGVLNIAVVEVESTSGLTPPPADISTGAQPITTTTSSSTSVLLTTEFVQTVAPKTYKDRQYLYYLVAVLICGLALIAGIVVFVLIAKYRKDKRAGERKNDLEMNAVN